MSDEPVPGKDLDNQLLAVVKAYRMTQKIVHWFLALISLIAVASLVVSLTTSSNQASTTQRTVANVVSAQCAFYYDIGTVPPPAKVTEFGVKILVDTRNAYVGLGCAGKLPIPSAALVQDAAHYGLQLKG